MTGPKLAFHSALLLACGVQVALSQNLDPLLPWRDFINAVDIPEFWPIDINLPSVGNIPGFEIGACRNPPTVPEFNVTAFLGDWYAAPRDRRHPRFSPRDRRACELSTARGARPPSRCTTRATRGAIRLRCQKSC